MKKLTALAALGLLGFMASGCATIVHGTTTRINIDSDPPGAIVKAGNQTTVTPGSLRLKNNKSQTLEISKEGYKPSIVYLDQTMSGWIWGNILCGGIIGVGIDMASGGAYRLEPNDVKVSLESESK